MLNVILKPEEVTVHAYDIDDDGGDGTEVELDGGWWEVVHSRRRISSWLLLGVAGSKNEPMTARQTVLGVLVRRDKFESECTEFYIRWYVFA